MRNDSSRTTMGYAFKTYVTAFVRRLAQVAGADGDYYADIAVEEEVYA